MPPNPATYVQPQYTAAMRLPVLLLPILLLFPAATHAQAGSPAAAPVGTGEPPDTKAPAPGALSAPSALPSGHLTGTVFCADTHKPARGALVLVMPLPADDGKDRTSAAPTQAMVRVGNDGTYTADHLAPGEYSAFAFQPGYLNSMEELTDQWGDGSEQRASPQRQREALLHHGSVVLHGSETATLNITLERGATLTGHVLYSDGAPAAQITLVLENSAKAPKDGKSSQDQAAAAAMMRSMFTHQTMSTDDEGRFRISGLQPGNYLIAATQPSQSGFDGNSGGDFFVGMVPDEHSLRFYAGDTPHRTGAKVFDLRAGDSVAGIEITIPVDAFHIVRGTVSAVDGRAVNMGSVTLTDTADDTLVFHASLDREGSFKLFQVPAGTYTLKTGTVRIGKVQRTKEMPADYPDTNFPLQPTNAFADGTTAVLVKDSDVSDINLSLNEVPLPKAEFQPPQPNDTHVVPEPQLN